MHSARVVPLAPAVLTTLVAALLALFALAPAPARAAAALGSPQAVRSGQAMVGVTVGVQAVNLGFTLAGFAGESGSSPWLVSNAISGAVAPVGVAGFERLLADGSPASRRRGLGLGLVEGGSYALLVGAFHLAYPPIYRARVLAAYTPTPEEEEEGYNPLFEDFTGMVHTVAALLHGVVALSFLVPGIVLLATQHRASARLRVPPVLPLAWGGAGSAGLGLTGRF